MLAKSAKAWSLPLVAKAMPRLQSYKANPTIFNINPLFLKIIPLSTKIIPLSTKIIPLSTAQSHYPTINIIPLTLFSYRLINNIYWLVWPPWPMWPTNDPTTTSWQKGLETHLVCIFFLHTFWFWFKFYCRYSFYSMNYTIGRNITVTREGLRWLTWRWVFFYFIHILDADLSLLQIWLVFY